MAYDLPPNFPIGPLYSQVVPAEDEQYAQARRRQLEDEQRRREEQQAADMRNRTQSGQQ